MAYKLVCIHEFHDDISGAMINRGDEIHDYEYIAKLYAANRMHHFNKVLLVMADAQWDWPPVVGVKSEPAAPIAASASTTPPVIDVKPEHAATPISATASSGKVK